MLRTNTTHIYRDMYIFFELTVQTQYCCALGDFLLSNALTNLPPFNLVMLLPPSPVLSFESDILNTETFVHFKQPIM